MKTLLSLILILSLSCVSCTRAEPDNFLVTKVFDGDTVRLSNGEKVRLIGIDCPEMYESDKLYRDAQRSGEDLAAIVARGRRSYKFTRELLEGKRVSLEYDVEKRDKYGRLLAYVYIENNDLWRKEENKDHAETILFVNAEIIEQGYAETMVIPPNLKYADYLEQLYQEAKENKKGLWNGEGGE